MDTSLPPTTLFRFDRFKNNEDRRERAQQPGRMDHFYFVLEVILKIC